MGADGVDAGTVVGVEKPRFVAVGLGYKPRIGWEGIEDVDDGFGVGKDGFGVCLDIAGGQGVGVGVVVVGEDSVSGGFEGVSDAGGAAKKIENC